MSRWLPILLAITLIITAGCGGKAARPGAALKLPDSATGLPDIPSDQLPSARPTAPPVSEKEFQERAAAIQQQVQAGKQPPEERAKALEAEAQTKLQQDPGSAEAHVLLGLAAYARDDYPGAIAHYQQATGLDDRTAMTWNLLGNAYRDHHQAEAAEAAYRKALALDPKLTVAYTNLTGLLQIQGRAPDALAVAEEGVRQLPGDVQIWILVGDLALLVDQVPKAITAYERALKLAPNFQPLLDRLQEAKAREGQGY